MAPELTHQQLQYIKGRLLEEGLHYDPLEDELLDHLCCAIEEKMANGTNFSIACEEAFAAFGKDGIQKLQSQTIRLLNQKSQRMKIISLAVIFLCGGLMTNYFIKPSAVPEEDVEVAVYQVEDILDKQEEEGPPSIRPIKGKLKVSSAFGMRKHPIFKKTMLHKGVDFRAPTGTPVLATASGTVSQAHRFKSGYGKHIYIKHDDTYTTLYSHLSEIKVTEGQEVSKGMVIGLVGSSGTSTAPHLHYGIIKNGKEVDPAPFLNP